MDFKRRKYRRTFKLFELRKIVLKSLLSAVCYKKMFKYYFNNAFRKISRRTSLGIYRKYCLFTYTGKVVFRKFKISRHIFKSMAALGLLTGVRKSSF